MVAANPLFTSPITLKKIRATAIADTWPEVVFFSLVATGLCVFRRDLRHAEAFPAVVAVVSDLTSTRLEVSNQILTVLGTVLGLVISFRTSTAYERCVACLSIAVLWYSIALQFL